MIIPLIFGVALGAFAVIFALQNITTITVTFYTWQVEGSLAVVLLAALATGAVITLLMLLPETVVSYFKYRRLLKENAVLQEDLRKQKELTTFAKKDSYTPEAHGSESL